MCRIAYRKLDSKELKDGTILDVNAYIRLQITQQLLYLLLDWNNRRMLCRMDSLYCG